MNIFWRVVRAGIASGRLWFCLLLMSVLMAWNESGYQAFINDERVALRDLMAGPEDVANDYQGIAARIELIRRNPAIQAQQVQYKRDIVRQAEQDLAQSQMPYYERYIWWERVMQWAGTVSMEREAMLREADRARIEKLQAIARDGREARKAFALNRGVIFGVVLLCAVAYRPRVRATALLAWPKKALLVSTAPVKAWWRGWNGEWLGLNRGQRALLTAVIGVLAGILFMSSEIRWIRNALDGQAEVLWGLFVPWLLVGAFGVSVLARPRTHC